MSSLECLWLSGRVTLVPQCLCPELHFQSQSYPYELT